MDEQTEYERQHLRLLEGLAASIREKGLPATQLTDIVRHARASRRTFYKHFPDKDAAFVELARTLADVGLEAVRAAMDPAADWETQTDQAIDAYLALLAAEPAMTLTFSSPSLGPSIVRAQRDGIERYAELVVDVTRGDAFRRAGIELTFAQGYVLVSGLNQVVVRAVERGEDLLALAPDLKAIFKAAMSPERSAASSGSAPASR